MAPCATTVQAETTGGPLGHRPDLLGEQPLMLGPKDGARLVAVAVVTGPAAAVREVENLPGQPRARGDERVDVIVDKVAYAAAASG